MSTAAALDELLPAYVLGIASPDERALVEDAFMVSPVLRREADRLAEALVTAVTASLVPVAPSAASRARLLAAAAPANDGAQGRFASFVDGLGRLFDLPGDAVRALLGKVDDPGAWLTGYADGLRYFNFTPGVRLAGADAGFVRLAPGARFPRHRHLEHEISVILAGAMRDGDDVYRPGDVVERAKDSVHDYATEGAEDLILVSLHRGIVPVD